ncbi:MAG: hypothetical protein AAF205_09500, partial [Pseudomonadota bacterium]
MKFISGLALLMCLAACASQTGDRTPPSAPAVADRAPAAPESALESGVSIVGFGDLPGWATTDVDGALAAFRKSCDRAVAREDVSGLVSADEWPRACAAARGAADARQFFETAFLPVRVADASAFVTGYYEPEIAG